MGEAAYCKKHTNRYLDAKGRCRSCDEATADTEQRGREQERADVVAWLKYEGFSCAAYEGVAHGRHVGAASKERK